MRHLPDSFEPPAVQDPNSVGSFPTVVAAGGGLVWDAVLEYRVWCRPPVGTADGEDDDYYRAFPTYREAIQYAAATPGCSEPLALVLQRQYVDEPEPGHYVHVQVERLTEWPVEFLTRPRRTEHTIPDFLASDAPANRLDKIRGIEP